MHGEPGERAGDGALRRPVRIAPDVRLGQMLRVGVVPERAPRPRREQDGHPTIRVALGVPRAFRRRVLRVRRFRTVGARADAHLGSREGDDRVPAEVERAVVQGVHQRVGDAVHERLARLPDGAPDRDVVQRVRGESARRRVRVRRAHRDVRLGERGDVEDVVEDFGEVRGEDVFPGRGVVVGGAGPGGRALRSAGESVGDEAQRLGFDLGEDHTAVHDDEGDERVRVRGREERGGEGRDWLRRVRERGRTRGEDERARPLALPQPSRLLVWARVAHHADAVDRARDVARAAPEREPGGGGRAGGGVEGARVVVRGVRGERGERDPGATRELPEAETTEARGEGRTAADAEEITTSRKGRRDATRANARGGRDGRRARRPRRGDGREHRARRRAPRPATKKGRCRGRAGPMCDCRTRRRGSEDSGASSPPPRAARARRAHTVARIRRQYKATSRVGTP